MKFEFELDEFFGVVVCYSITRILDGKQHVIRTIFFRFFPVTVFKCQAFNHVCVTTGRRGPNLMEVAKMARKETIHGPAKTSLDATDTTSS